MRKRINTNQSIGKIDWSIKNIYAKILLKMKKNQKQKHFKIILMRKFKKFDKNLKKKNGQLFQNNK